MSPFRPEAAALRAGRLMLEEIKLAAKRRESFGFETTLAGRGHLSLISRVKKSGYEPRITKRPVEEEEVSNRAVKSTAHHSFRYVVSTFHDPGFHPRERDSGATPNVIAFEKRGSVHIMNRGLYDTLISHYGKP